jgi:carboxymethylenebutenolidase
MDFDLVVNNKKANAYLAVPPAQKGPAVLLLHAWWGLNPFFKELCDRLAQAGFVALAPDLNEGIIANTIDEARGLEKQRNFEFIGNTIVAARDSLLQHPACTSKKLGLIGFSFGAAWALVVASQNPEKVAATVLYYGNYEVDYTKIKSKILGHYADADQEEPIAVTRDQEKKLHAAGVDATFYIYPGLNHWFFEPGRPEYDAAAADLSWVRTLAFLKENVK